MKLIFVPGGEKPFRVLAGFQNIVVVDQHGQVMKTFGLTENESAEAFASSLNK